MTDDDRPPILHSPLDLRRRPLWLGELELFEDYLAISGWTWTGTVCHVLAIADIRTIEKRPTVPRSANFVIRPHERRAYYCQIEARVFYWVKEFRDDNRMDLEVRH